MKESIIQLAARDNASVCCICAMRRVHGSSGLQREITWVVALHVQAFVDKDVNGIRKGPFLNPHPFSIVQEILESQKSLLDVCPSSVILLLLQRCDFHTFKELELRGDENLFGKP